MSEASDRKPLIWMGRSRRDIGEFPDRVKGELGYGLDLAQAGEKHENAKPLKGFKGAGVLELVEDFDGDTYRAVYTVKLTEIVYVLHVFQKKSKSGIATESRNLLNIDEDLLSNLSRGRLTELTLENLFRYLNILGRDLEIVLKPLSKATKGNLKLTII